MFRTVASFAFVYVVVNNCVQFSKRPFVSRTCAPGGACCWRSFCCCWRWRVLFCGETAAPPPTARHLTDASTPRGLASDRQMAVALRSGCGVRDAEAYSTYWYSFFARHDDDDDDTRTRFIDFISHVATRIRIVKIVMVITTHRPTTAAAATADRPNLLGVLYVLRIIISNNTGKYPFPSVSYEREGIFSSFVPPPSCTAIALEISALRCFHILPTHFKTNGLVWDGEKKLITLI